MKTAKQIKIADPAPPDEVYRDMKREARFCAGKAVVELKHGDVRAAVQAMRDSLLAQQEIARLNIAHFENGVLESGHITTPMAKS